MMLLTDSLKAHQGTRRSVDATRAIMTEVRISRENLSVRYIIIAFSQIVMVTESVGGSANQQPWSPTKGVFHLRAQGWEPFNPRRKEAKSAVKIVSGDTEFTSLRSLLQENESSSGTEWSVITVCGQLCSLDFTISLPEDVYLSSSFICMHVLVLAYSTYKNIQINICRYAACKNASRTSLLKPTALRNRDRRYDKGNIDT